MPSINIYKIDEQKKTDFNLKIKEKYKKPMKVIEEKDNKFSLYFADEKKKDKITWSWVLESFGEKPVYSYRNPQGIILIENKIGTYAVSFSYAYFLIDQYCDRNFAFDFARRLKYKKVKTMALTNPNSQRNKTINTYIDYETIDFDSGESLTKIKAEIKISEDFNLFSENIEIGNSIKFNVADPTLNKLGNIIVYIEDTIKNCEELVKIPLYIRIRDKKLINDIEEDFLAKIRTEDIEVEFSEYEIYATNIIFNVNDEYELIHRGYRQIINSISYKEICNFNAKYGISIDSMIFDSKIIVYRDGRSIYTEQLKNLIFFTNEKEHAILSKGEWFRYNNDYLSYLRDSISEISTIYDEKYNYKRSEHKKFLNQKYKEEKDDKEHQGLKANEIKEKIKRKYYKENFFNLKLERYEFKCIDRDISSLGKHKYEVADLFKNKTLYTVKIGNSSSKLSYAVDQSLIVVDLIKKNQIQIKTGEVQKVCLWLILDRKTKLSIEKDGNVNLDELEMIILKNKIDNWKKEVRLRGYTPEIFINYVED